MAVREAVAMACRVRLRPVLMTSLATIIGLLPMALKLGEGSESYAPLARALLGGLTLSVIDQCSSGAGRIPACLRDEGARLKRGMSDLIGFAFGILLFAAPLLGAAAGERT